jgi:hypothetical protein
MKNLSGCLKSINIEHKKEIETVFIISYSRKNYTAYIKFTSLMKIIKEHYFTSLLAKFPYQYHIGKYLELFNQSYLN